MKTAGRENPNRWARAPRNRAHGAAGQNRSRSIKWAAKQEKFQPQQVCFFLTSTFRRKAHFFVETVTLAFFGSIAVSPSQRFETLWF
jgi:hypothetical protein